MGKVILGAFLGMGFLIFIGAMVSTNRNIPTVREASSTASADSGISGTSTDQVVSQPAISVSALKLWLDYQANEVAADNAYKGRRLAVSGIVNGIKKDFVNKTYLTLVSPNEFMDVHADLRDEYVSDAANLRQGQTIFLDCDGGGMFVGSPFLKDCSFQLEKPHAAAAMNVPPPEPEGQAIPSQPEDAKPVYVPSAKVTALIKQEEALNDKCRDGSGEDESTQAACTRREGLLATLKSQGWCWGHEGQVGADMTWEHCGPVSQ